MQTNKLALTAFDEALQQRLSNFHWPTKVKWEEIENRIPKKSSFFSGPLSGVHFSKNSGGIFTAVIALSNFKAALLAGKKKMAIGYFLAGFAVLSGAGIYFMNHLNSIKEKPAINTPTTRAEKPSDKQPAANEFQHADMPSVQPAVKKHIHEGVTQNSSPVEVANEVGSNLKPNEHREPGLNATHSMSNEDQLQYEATKRYEKAPSADEPATLPVSEAVPQLKSTDSIK